MIFRSRLEELEIPEIPLTPFILSRAERWGAKPALVDAQTGRSITYEQFARDVRLAAAGLARRGMRALDVLAIYSPNLPEYAVAFHAVSLLGGVVTTVNPLYTVEEVAPQLKDSRAKYLLTAPQLFNKALAAASETEVREIFVFGEEKSEAASFSSLLKSGETEIPAPDITVREDTVALLYSSGTTGLPKGVMLTHHNVVANTLMAEAMRIITHEDTQVCFLPFFHCYGLNAIMNLGLYTGATTVTMPRFDMEQFLKTVCDYNVTHAPLVPPIVLALTKLEVVDSYDLSCLKSIFSGAAPLGEDVSRALIERLGCKIRQGYGLTETSPIVTVTPSDDEKLKLGSVGVCAPNTECKIVDTETGAELGHGEKGEICVRGPQVMKGYLNRPEATAATIDSEGWLHTGDVGYADSEGHFFIVDRVKELIKYKGFQVAPAELEAVLLTHHAILEAAVIPKQDEEAGEIPKAFVVLRSPATAEEICAYVAERVAPHKKIREIEFTEMIPKTQSGKILRRMLVQKERENSN